MNMKNSLTRIAVAIENCPVTASGDASLISDLFCHQMKFTYYITVINGDVIQSWDMFLRYDQNVMWCLRTDVVECENGIRIIDNITRNLLIHNFAKKTVTQQPAPDLESAH